MEVPFPSGVSVLTNFGKLSQCGRSRIVRARTKLRSSADCLFLDKRGRFVSGLTHLGGGSMKAEVV